MSNHQQRYKKKPVGFEDSNAGRLVRTIKLEERRRVNRNENYFKHRDVPEAAENDESAAPASREIRFQRWKAERDLRRKIESQKKKPVFKVGVVHHKFYSPVQVKTQAKPMPCHGKGVHKVKHQPTPPKRITRATQKRLEAKKAGNIATPGVASTSGAQTHKSNRTKLIKKPKTLPTPKKLACSFAPENYSFKAPPGLEGVPLFGAFLIPKNAEADKPNSDNNIDGESKNEEEKPWPRASNPSVDIMAPQKIRPSFVRQNAQERLSTNSVSTENGSVSSIEEITLRLSSEDESPEQTEESKTTEAKNSATQPDFSTVPEKTDESEISEEVRKLETPPRSGSPAPASFSPYIVSSRGKNSARKEQQMKMGIRRSLSGNNIPTKETVMQNLNISIEEEEQTAQYFKFLLESTINSLKELCNKWAEIMQEPDLPEDAQYQINQAIGQTNLLIRKKFERFRGLVLDCETGKGEMLVTCKDLQGFWDVMYIEVDNIKARFLKLEILKSKDWVEEQFNVPNKRVTKKKTVAPKPKVAAKSSARSWILAARKKMTQPEDSGDINSVSAAEKEGKKAVRTPLKDGNSRRSLRESPTSETKDRRRNSTPKATPRKTPASLRKVVQLSQASKAIRSPLAIIKISKMCKTPEVTLDNTISYVNSDQTPAKGILKKSESSTSAETTILKSTRKVDFNDDVLLDEVAVENEITEELQNSLDLGRALAKIDSYNEDEEDDYSPVECNSMKNVTIRKVEKRLDFEDQSFSEIENTDTGEAIVAVMPETPALDAEIPEPAAVFVFPPQIPKVEVIPATPIHASKTDRKSLNWSEIFEISTPEVVPEEPSVSTRVLRNRTVAPTTPSKSNRKSIKSPPKDKHSHDSSTKENCDPLRERKDTTNSHSHGIEGTKDAPATPRRSTRKSIRLGADECLACTPKPVTPHSVRSRKSQSKIVAVETSRKSVGGDLVGDLMSFDSPIKRPTRNRRSSIK